MIIRDFIRGIFGLKRNDEGNYPPIGGDDFSNKFKNPIWQNDDDDDDDDDEDIGDPFRRGQSIGFHVFTNPLEIHRYFEQQLNEFMKSFHQGPLENDLFFGDMNPSFDSFFGGFNDLFSGGPSKFALPAPADEGNPSRGMNLRDFYLKPEYESPKSDWESFRDSDLDGKIGPKDIGEILSRSSDPFKSDAKPRKSSFGNSMTSKTIRHADGTMETHKTIKDSQGNEETTTTYQKGEQSYTVTVLKDANGEEKRLENFNNVDNDKISEFRSIFDSNKPILPSSEHQPRDNRGPPAGASDDLSYWCNKFFKN